MAKQIKLIKRASAGKTDQAPDLVSVCRDFLRASIAQSNDPALPRDTDVDEYIDMVAAQPRAVRRSLRGINLAMTNLCRALKAQRDAAAQAAGDAQ